MFPLRGDTTVYGCDAETKELPATSGGLLVATNSRNGQGRLAPGSLATVMPIEKDDAYFRASADILESLLECRDDDPKTD
jgi:hypothetical protein